MLFTVGFAPLPSADQFGGVVRGFFGRWPACARFADELHTVQSSATSPITNSEMASRIAVIA